MAERQEAAPEEAAPIATFPAMTWALGVVAVWVSFRWPLLSRSAVIPDGVRALWSAGLLHDLAAGPLPGALLAVLAGLATLAPGVRLAGLIAPEAITPTEQLVVSFALGTGGLATVLSVLALAGGFCARGVWLAAAASVVAGLCLGPRAPVTNVYGTLLRLPRRAIRKARDEGPLAALALLLLSGAAGVLFLKSCIPPWYPDALFYHLALPKRYLQDCGFVAVPEEPINSGLPGLAQMLFALPLAAGRPELAALWSWLHFVFLVPALALLARRVGGRAAATLAAASLVGVPHMLWMAVVPLADMPMLFHLTLALHATLRAIQTRGGGPRWAAMAALAMGLSLTAKLQALPVVAILAATLAVATTRRRALSCEDDGAGAGLSVAAAALTREAGHVGPGTLAGPGTSAGTDTATRQGNPAGLGMATGAGMRTGTHMDTGAGAGTGDVAGMDSQGRRGSSLTGADSAAGADSALEPAGAVSLLRYFAAGALLIVLPLAPWLLKNAFEWGCPFFPLVLSGATPEPVRHLLAMFRADWLTHGQGASLVWLPFDVTLLARSDLLSRYEGQLGAWPLALVPIALVYFRRLGCEAALLLALGLLLASIWAVGAREVRYLLFAIPPLAAAVAALTRISPKLTACVFALSILSGTLQFVGEARPAADADYLLGREPWSLYYKNLAATGDLFECSELLSEEPSGARVLFFWEDRGFFCPRPFLADHLVPGSSSHILHSLPPDAAGALVRLHALGVTHVLVNFTALREARSAGVTWAWQGTFDTLCGWGALMPISRPSSADLVPIQLYRVVPAPASTLAPALPTAPAAAPGH